MENKRLEFFKKYRMTSGGSNVACYFLEYEGGVTANLVNPRSCNYKPIVATRAACHADLACAGTEDTVAIHNSLWYNSNWARYKDVEAFWLWMFDPKESPYRNCLPLHQVEFYHDNGEMIGFRLPIEKDTRAQALVNFLIALRLCFEHSKHWSTFAKTYKQMGCLDAFFLAHVAPVYDRDLLSLESDNWHKAFDGSQKYKLLKDGTPKFSKGMFREGAGYRPSDIIWSGGGSATYQLKQILTVKKTDFKYNGVFRRLWDAENVANERKATFDTAYVIDTLTKDRSWASV